MDVCHEPGFLSRIAARPGFAAFLTDAAQSFDYVILNAPPCRTASDAAMLGAVADMTVAVAQDGRYTPRELGAALRSLRGGRRGFLPGTAEALCPAQTPCPARPSGLNQTGRSNDGSAENAACL